mmetsp:Transcript_37223/g.59761  ORF Transcript_37223/g.59761 Transcript_37223/m.59761 type:complete len:241 (-) Transcript_37223:409-1131(-)
MLPLLFVGAGVALVTLRKHALHADECYDFTDADEVSAHQLTPRACCGTLHQGRESEGLTADQSRASCKFCDADASCRFCFAGPEKGELIAPCACVGSQELVHTTCLRQWQKVAMRTKGNRESNCRVCHAAFRLPVHPIGQRCKLWFSFKAKDRLNAYSGVWFQSLFQLFVAQKKRIAPTVVLARSSSAHELAIMLASTEVRIWAGREVRHGKKGPCIIKAMAWFGSVVNVLAKLKAAGVF